LRGTCARKFFRHCVLTCERSLNPPHCTLCGGFWLLLELARACAGGIDKIPRAPTTLDARDSGWRPDPESCGWQDRRLDGRSCRSSCFCSCPHYTKSRAQCQGRRSNTSAALWGMSFVETNPLVGISTPDRSAISSCRRGQERSYVSLVGRATDERPDTSRPAARAGSTGM